MINSIKERLDKVNFAKISRTLDIDESILKALFIIETDEQDCFVAPGHPSIKFQGHIFWHQLKMKRKPINKYLEGNEDILYPIYSNKYYKEGIDEYLRLERAVRIDKKAALSATSWGSFQIMGFNHPLCGSSSISKFVKDMKTDETHQLKLFSEYIKNTNLITLLKNNEWTEFANQYNGFKQSKSLFDVRLATAVQYFKYDF